MCDLFRLVPKCLEHCRHKDTSAPVLKCPTDTSAPVPKCLGAKVSVHRWFQGSLINARQGRGGKGQGKGRGTAPKLGSLYSCILAPAKLAWMVSLVLTV